MVSWLSTATAEGVLYQVDLRLRPEAKPDLSQPIDRLETYFAHDVGLGKLALTKHGLSPATPLLQKSSTQQYTK